MSVLPALGVALIVVLLLIVPAVIVWREVRDGRPDPAYDDD